MTLIGILGALALERALSHWSYWRTHDLTGHWLAFVRQRSPSAPFWSNRWGLALLILPPVLAVWAVLHYLVEPLGLLIELAVGVVILLACLGPRDMAEELNSYRAARQSGDTKAADEIRADILRGPHRGNGQAKGRSVVAAAFVQGHERWFGVVLYFFFLGPLGALMYRLSASVPAQLRELSVEGELLDMADLWHGLAAWPSSRLTALCYALAGSWDHALSAWQKWRTSYNGKRFQDAWALLANVGIGCLVHDSEGEEDRCLELTLSVLNRALMILLAVFALFTLGGSLA